MKTHELSYEILKHPDYAVVIQFGACTYLTGTVTEVTGGEDPPVPSVIESGDILRSARLLDIELAEQDPNGEAQVFEVSETAWYEVKEVKTDDDQRKLTIVAGELICC